MIQIDRSSPRPVHAQLYDQLRFELTSGRYRIGDSLPSTRVLGDQLGVSFHTVRKVYQQLEREGLLDARPGAGYRVAEPGPVRTEDRMERGASIAHEALKRMMSLGLGDADIDYLFQEQRALLEGAATPMKVVAAAPYREMAERCAGHVSNALQVDVEAAAIDDLTAHSDADYILVPYRAVRRARQAVPGADIVGVSTSLQTSVLEALADLPADATVGIVVRDADAVQPLMHEVRTATGFTGQMVGLSVDERADDLARRLKQMDLVLATPGCLRRVRSHAVSRVYVADPAITSESIDRVRSALPH